MSIAIRKHWKDFAAVIVLMLIAAGVGGYILSNQRFYLPKWVPVVGSDFYTLNAQFSTAQAVTPGQGQSVDIAGVKVGEISKVDLVNWRAVVQMKIKRKYSKIYNDASILLRPKTGLKDMILELDPGTVTSGEVKDNGTIPVSSRCPTSTPTRSSRSSTATPATTCASCSTAPGRGSRTTARPSRRRSGASSRPRATA